MQSMCADVFRISDPAHNGTITVNAGTMTVTIKMTITPALPNGGQPTVTITDANGNVMTGNGVLQPNGEYHAEFTLPNEWKTGGSRAATVRAEVNNPGEERHSHEIDITWAAPAAKVAARKPAKKKTSQAKTVKKKTTARKKAVT